MDLKMFNDMSIGGGIAIAAVAICAAYVAVVFIREFFKWMNYPYQD